MCFLQNLPDSQITSETFSRTETRLLLISTLSPNMGKIIIGKIYWWPIIHSWNCLSTEVFPKNQPQSQDGAYVIVMHTSFMACKGSSYYSDFTTETQGTWVTCSSLLGSIMSKKQTQMWGFAYTEKQWFKKRSPGSVKIIWELCGK